MRTGNGFDRCYRGNRKFCITAGAMTRTAPRQHLRSTGSRQLFVPRYCHLTFGHQAFSVAGLAAWNLLPDYLRDPTRSFGSFRSDLKTFLFPLY